MVLHCCACANLSKHETENSTEQTCICAVSCFAFVSTSTTVLQEQVANDVLYWGQLTGTKTLLLAACSVSLVVVLWRLRINCCIGEQIKVAGSRHHSIWYLHHTPVCFTPCSQHNCSPLAQARSEKESTEKAGQRPKPAAKLGSVWYCEHLCLRWDFERSLAKVSYLTPSAKNYAGCVRRADLEKTLEVSQELFRALLKALKCRCWCSTAQPICGADLFTGSKLVSAKPRVDAPCAGAH